MREPAQDDSENKRAIQDLFAQHTDRVSDKWSHYLPEYARILSPYRERPIGLLEIGVQNGGSLEIWAKCFPNAKALIGCDVNPACSSLNFADPRITVIAEDANSDSAQTRILACSPILDIIIDDGSHRSSDIVRSFARYFPHLKDGGIYVAEDLHCSYWQETEGGLFMPHSSIAFFKRLIDIVNREFWGIGKPIDDILNGFAAVYDIKFDVESLNHIHALEFTNSMCVIRKEVAASNELGKRVVAGSIADIHPGLFALRGTEVSQTPEARDQSANPWAARELPPEEELLIRLAEIDELKSRVQQLQRAVADCTQRAPLEDDSNKGGE